MRAKSNSPSPAQRQVQAGVKKQFLISISYLQRQRTNGPVAQGSGWAVMKGDELHGMIFFLGDDDSEFVGEKQSRLPPKSTKVSR
jgi:hypothetical protein